MKKRLQHITTVGTANAKYAGMGSYNLEKVCTQQNFALVTFVVEPGGMEKYKAQVRDAYKNMKLKQVCPRSFVQDHVLAHLLGACLLTY